MPDLNQENQTPETAPVNEGPAAAASTAEGGVHDPVTLIRGGVKYHLPKNVVDALDRAVSDSGTVLEPVEEGTSTESDTEGGTSGDTVYCVSIDQVTQEDVDSVTALVGGEAKITLFAINPGRATRTDEMEALERLCEQNDVVVYHDLEALAYFIKSTDVPQAITGPIAEEVNTVLGAESEEIPEEPVATDPAETVSEDEGGEAAVSEENQAE